MRVNIVCVTCNKEADEAGNFEDGWEFVNVPMNTMTREIIVKHEEMYSHKVTVRKAR